VDYLEWLYFENPNGPAIGFDAFDGDLLVAHYVCIPIWIDSFQKPSLLALNTATHPKYQGRGLLKILANNTYAKYGDTFACVVGVANAQAIKPLTRHLDFEHLGDLDLRFGFLDLQMSGRRVYSVDEIAWRVRSPGRALMSSSSDAKTVKFTRRLYGFIFLSATSPLRNAIIDNQEISRKGRSFGLTLDWRRDKKPRVFLPRRFKPSPLSLVFRPLSESDSSKLTVWTFPDFDVF
jgi:hypothetical protein